MRAKQVKSGVQGLPPENILQPTLQIVGKVLSFRKEVAIEMRGSNDHLLFWEILEIELNKNYLEVDWFCCCCMKYKQDSSTTLITF